MSVIESELSGLCAKSTPCAASGVAYSQYCLAFAVTKHPCDLSPVLPPSPPPAAAAPGVTQVPVIQVMLGQLGIISSAQMFSLWRYVVVGSTIAAAVLTPSTDPFTQALLAAPLVGLYMGGALVVRTLEGGKPANQGA